MIMLIKCNDLPNHKVYIDQRPPAFPTDAITTYGHNS